MDAVETGEAVRRVFDLQRAHRWTVSATTATQRVERLARLRQAVRERRADLVAAVQGDFGTHPTETEITEFIPVVEGLSAAIRQLPRWMRPRRVGTPLTLFGSRSRVIYEATGTVLVLSHARAVLDQVLPSSLTLLFPPYGRRTERMMSLLRRIAG